MDGVQRTACGGRRAGDGVRGGGVQRTDDRRQGREDGFAMVDAGW